MICFICSGFRIGVVSEPVRPSCAVVAGIVFGRDRPGSCVSLIHWMTVARVC